MRVPRRCPALRSLPSALLGLLLLACGRGEPSRAPAGEGNPGGAATVDRTLLYPAEGDLLLHAVPVRLEAVGTPEEAMALVARRYVENQPAEGFFSPFPEGCTVRALFLLPGGRLVVDLAGPVTAGSGTSTEALRVYGLVDTLAANFPEVRSVRILVEGHQVETLLGHLDVSGPIPPQAEYLGPELRASGLLAERRGG